MEYVTFTNIIIFGLIITIFLSFFTVNQQSAYLIERFGKFARIAKPGLNFKLPYIETIAGKVNLRLAQLDVEVETKTMDDVFVDSSLCVRCGAGPGS